MSLPQIHSPINSSIPYLIRERKDNYQTHFNTKVNNNKDSVKVEFRKMMYACPFLFLSGLFSGMAIILMM